MSERCQKSPNVACARMANHAGVCCAAPSAATLDFDRARAERDTLASLDFPAPWWADLRDP